MLNVALVALTLLTPQAHTEDIVVALSDHLDKPGAVAVVIRQGGHRAIVLKADATTSDLAAALGTYRRLQRQSTETRIVIKKVSGTPLQTAAQVAVAEMLLARLRAKSETNVPGFGQARSEQVRLEPTGITLLE